jgi:spermidine synthase
MALEVSFARLIAPFFGTSLFVWTSIIGSALIALSAGYYAGGKVADTSPALTGLYRLMLAAGLIFFILPYAAPWLAGWLQGTFFASSIKLWYAASLAVCLPLMGAPMALLGMSTPYLIRALAAERTPGQAAGTVSAFSTLGSIVGTFSPTWLFIPNIGTSMTIRVFALLLIAYSSFSLTLSIRKRSTAVVLCLLAALLPSISFLGKVPAGFGHAESTRLRDFVESPYQLIRVFEDAQGLRYLTYEEGRGIQSAYAPGDRLVTGGYYDAGIVLPALAPENKPIRVLVLGLAGGTIARGLDSVWQDRVSLEGVEIDGRVLKVARRHFGLDDIPMRVHEAEGRAFVASAEDQWDIVIVDVYQNEMYIPWTMTTREFWASVSSHLSLGGIVAMNVNSRGQSRLLQALGNTVASVFPFAYRSPVGQGDSWNYFLIAANDQPDFERLVRNQTLKDSLLYDAAFALSRSVSRINFNPALTVLTDDRAPVEIMTLDMFAQASFEQK